MTALVVDDSGSMRRIIGHILADLGFAVRQARDGQDALAELAAGGPADVALIDWNMPVMTGIDLLRAVRRDPAYAGMRAVMVTTECDPGRVAEALAAGADEYVMKPFTEDVLRAKLCLLGFEPAGAA